jgi:hypothetical protein
MNKPNGMNIKLRKGNGPMHIMTNFTPKKKTKYADTLLTYHIKKSQARMLVHFCNPSTQEGEEGHSRAPGQPGLQSEFEEEDSSKVCLFVDQIPSLQSAPHDKALCV